MLIALADPALEPSPTWTRIDDTDNFVSKIEIRRGRQTEFDQTETSTATVYINDTEGVIEPGGGGLLEDIDGRQIMLQLLNPVTSTWVTQYRGLVDDMTFDFNPAGVVSNVQIECVDLFDYLAGVEMLPGTFGDTPPAGSEGVVFYEDTDFQTRLKQILTDSGLDPDFFEVLTGNVDLQETKYDPGDSILVAIRDAVDAEFPGIANVYTDKLGRVCAHGRFARFDPDSVKVGTYCAFTRWKAGDVA